MPEAGWNEAELLQRSDPGVKAREAQRLQTEGLGSELSRALEDRVFDSDPETRTLALSLLPGLRDPLSPELLPAALLDPCPEVVLAAAEAMVALRLPHTCDALSECLASRPELSGPLALALARLEEPGAEELLIDRLGEAEPAVRAAVLRALGASGTGRSKPEIARFLDGGDPALETEALDALLRLRERFPQAVERGDLPPGLLERALARLDPAGDRRSSRLAISLLAWLRPQDAPARLLELADTRDRAMRARALEAFGVLAAGGEGAALEAIASVADRAPSLAAEALDRVPAARQEGSLARSLALLAHREPRVRERAAALAGRSGGRGAGEALLALTADPVGHVRGQAAEALGLLRWRGAGPRLEALLFDPYPDVRQAAQGALRAIREHEVDALTLFQRAPDGAGRAAALRAGEPRRTPMLFESAVSDPDPEVRLAVAATLNERRTWLDGAAALLADEDPRIRAHALRARLKAPTAEGLLPLEPFLRDADAGVRQTFAAGLEQAHGMERAGYLRALLFDPGPAVGRAAARALGAREDEDAVSALLEAVSTASPPVAAQAIESLGALGAAQALPRLRAVARGGDPSLRALAAEAARRIEAAA